jgi:hypothetical protein
MVALRYALEHVLSKFDHLNGLVITHLDSLMALENVFDGIPVCTAYQAPGELPVSTISRPGGIGFRSPSASFAWSLFLATSMGRRSRSRRRLRSILVFLSLRRRMDPRRATSDS